MKLAAAELRERSEQGAALLDECALCPRRCAVDRNAQETGRCGVGRFAVVASLGPHFGEEPPLVGTRGSGTVFFSGCNMDCVFCQNYDISHDARGAQASPEDLAAAFMKIQSLGCHNLNLVTPTHVTPQILEGLSLAVEQSFSLPIVYNCGGYESVETLRLLDGVVDIYMPDMKYGDDEAALELSGVPDYVSRSRAAAKEMWRQVGDLVIGRDGLAERGLLIRHLVLPENAARSEEVYRFLSERLSKDTYLNIMDQYRPAGRLDRIGRPCMKRPLRTEEVVSSAEKARSFGLWRGFSTVGVTW